MKAAGQNTTTATAVVTASLVTWLSWAPAAFEANLGLKSLKYHEWKMKVAGAVGFETTIPVLETGALSRTKLRPCGFVERGIVSACPPSLKRVDCDGSAWNQSTCSRQQKWIGACCRTKSQAALEC